jgi:cellulose synthase/poly-beta-1,6-N-acetylglucosamine synthase-like glycosyltransferase
MLSIIVPVRNGAQTLSDCLTALERQTLPREQFEIIVVDDGSTDESAEVARRAGVTVASLTASGPAAARNHGARLACGELLFFTDADCVPAPDWAERLRAAFDDPAVAGAKGAYRTRERGWVPRFVQLEYDSKYERMSRQPMIDFIDTYSAAYRRSVFLASGGFDASFPTPSVEDQEFSFRLAEQGHKLIFIPQAIVYHRHDLTLFEYAGRKFRIGYWKAALLRLHPAKVWGDSHTPLSQRLQIGLLGAAVMMLALGWWSPPVVTVALSFLLLFVLSAVPFLLFVLKHDLSIVMIAPLMVVARALALGMGLTLGGARNAWTAAAEFLRYNLRQFFTRTIKH